jgi:ATP adenylyltransferase
MDEWRRFRLGGGRFVAHRSKTKPFCRSRFKKIFAHCRVPGFDFWLQVFYFHPHMDALHAPWRIEYILAPKTRPEDSSLFSRIAQSADDESNYVVARDRTCFALLNAYPYTGGHLLIVPYRQCSDLYELTEAELLDLMKLTRRCQEALKRLMRPDGFNIGLNLGKVAGAGIAEHLHMHLVPRWQGDTNFMPVLAQTIVLPQALQQLAAQIRAALAEPIPPPNAG